jgi:hypothetical protein
MEQKDGAGVQVMPEGGGGRGNDKVQISNAK